jgi:alkanesulfonate monooxygenase SsuD/methylene tetrahydromethanopterin reductase-like flavin-dependent oxidoreductase (luciferase family)
LRTAAEVADGVLPFLMSPEKADAIVAPLREGLAAAPGKTFADFDNAPYVRIRMGDDLAACRDALRAHLAFYIGGMGARSKNFYNDLVKRMGYEAEAARIQDLFLDGKRNEAAAAVPDALIDETCLIGPPARIKDRLQAWQELARDNRLGTMLLADANVEAIRVVAEAVL